MVNKQGVINFTLPDEVKITIEQLANKRKVSEGAICRYAITKFLEEEIKVSVKNESQNTIN